MELIFISLVFFSIGFSIVTSLILLHNKSFFKGLENRNKPACLDSSAHPNKENEPSKSPKPLVSVLIPARNEENNLPRLLESLKKQTYTNLEIYVLDDHSEDQTKKIAEDFFYKLKFPGNVLSGRKKPDSWLGKNWACHQLSETATGQILLFLDADTWLSESFISDIVEKMDEDNLDFATVWPHQVMQSFLEKTIISMVYSTVVAYLPTHYSFQAPGWIPARSLRHKVKPLFASACGQCMVFRAGAYKEIGGHALVKTCVVEDVKIAKRVVSSGKTMRMFHGTNRIWCRMYSSASDLFQGFRKNFFAGFDYRLLPFLTSWILHIVVYLVPLAALIMIFLGIMPGDDYHLLLIVSLIALLIPHLQRFWISRFLKWPVSTALLLIPGVLWFQMLAFVVLADYYLKTGAKWKGRTV